MKLKVLCKGLPFDQKYAMKEIDVLGISSDSRYTRVGDLFIAKKGAQYEGVDYMEDAASQGASAFITYLYHPFIKAPQLICPHPEQLEAALLHRFYEQCTKKMYLIGVTGTNGKTTTSHLIHHILATESNAGLMSTLGIYYQDLYYPTSLTTNSIAQNVKTLHSMLHSGANSCVMEVSSHGLNQGRVEECCFDQAIFLNLSQDHLDYHQTMEKYFEAKAQLFSHLQGSNNPCIIANRDDPYFKKIKEIAQFPVISFGSSQEADIQLVSVQLLEGKAYLELRCFDQLLQIETVLWQQYNFYNIMAAVASALHKKVPIPIIQESISTFIPLQGRMEKVDKGYEVYVDFAHTPQALQEVLRALRKKTERRLIIVFGCGGERDREKRPLMAQVIEQYCDKAIVTSDNPRSESVDQIISEVIKGFSKKGLFIVQPDRKEAIISSLDSYQEGDTILIAGKGHEKTQVNGLKSIPFDDVSVVRECIQQKKVRC